MEGPQQSDSQQVERSFSDVDSWTNTTSETEGREILEVGVYTKGPFIGWICRVDPTVGEKSLRVGVLFGVTVDGPMAMLNHGGRYQLETVMGYIPKISVDNSSFRETVALVFIILNQLVGHT